MDSQLNHNRDAEQNPPQQSSRIRALELDFLPEATFLTEESALARLESRELSPAAIQELLESTALLRSRKVCIALASHPGTPRHFSLRLLRQFYTFDLMQFALKPSIAADLKRAADESLISRLGSISLGERLTLARRGSQAVAAELLLDHEGRVFESALENGRLNEAAVIKALARHTASTAFVRTVCRHPKWSLRKEIRIALLRNRHTPFMHAMEFARSLPFATLRDVLHASSLPERIKIRLLEQPPVKK